MLSILNVDRREKKQINKKVLWTLEIKRMRRRERRRNVDRVAKGSLVVYL